MADHSSQAPRHGGSHFGGQPTGAPARTSRASHAAGTGAGAPASHVQHRHAPTGGEPLPVMHGGTGAQRHVGTQRVSSRTAAATRRAGARSVQRARKGPSRAPLFAAALALLAVVGAVCMFVVVPLLKGSDAPSQQVAEGTEVTFTIPDGAGASAIAQTLYENGLISSTNDFITYARKVEAENSMQSGTYKIAAGTDVAGIVDALKSGPNVKGPQVIVPEGYNVNQIAAAVEQAFGIPAADFVAQAKASNYVADYAFLEGVANDSLEGYLFPKTYSFTGTPTADDVIRAMLSQFETEVASLDLEASAKALSERYGISVSQSDVVTMASIVEKEALTDEQRGKIASVFFNRLGTGMRLQSDATLAYTLNREVTADDLKVDDPYNTYTRDGLTPTPICSPSLASLRAAANPDNTDYFYFFITADGFEAFSETHDQHNAAIAEYTAR